MREKARISGMVTVRVFDKDGNIKRKNPGFFRRLLGLQGREILSRHHNIVTKEGDALIADALSETPVKTKVLSTSGYIQVGTGYSSTNAKTRTRCNTPTGSMKALDTNYPALLASWGNTGDTTVVYRTTFAAGNLNATGINEACLLNGNGNSANCLAYAQIDPPVNVTTSDTLQVQWEITILGQ